MGLWAIVVAMAVAVGIVSICMLFCRVETFECESTGISGEAVVRMVLLFGVMMLSSTQSLE
jgi:hypothetical protein